MDYYLHRQGAVYGPYTAAQMQAFVAEGRVQLTGFARTATMAQWQPLHMIWNQQPAPVLRPGPQPIVVAVRGNAISWPFHQRDWFASLWMTLLWWFPLPLLPLGVILNLGWSIDAARRRSWKAPDLLPRAGLFGRMLLDGLTVAFFFCAYIVIPVTVAWMITSLQSTSFVIATAQWAWHYFRGEVAGNFGDILTNIIVEHFRNRAMIVVYVLLSWPLFTAAVIRFVLTRKAGSFVHLPACLGILFGNAAAFFQCFVLAGLTAVAVTVADTLVASTVIAAPLVILLGSCGIWVVTYLFGDLAQKVAPGLQAEICPAQAVRAAGAQVPLG